jgi:hypothetical protein
MIEVTAAALAGHPFLRGMPCVTAVRVLARRLQGTRTRLVARSMSGTADGA